MARDQAEIGGPAGAAWEPRSHLTTRRDCGRDPGLPGTQTPGPPGTATVYAHLLGDSELDRAAAVFDEGPEDAGTMRPEMREGQSRP